MLVVTLNGDYEMLLLSKCTPVTDQSPIKAFYESVVSYCESGTQLDSGFMVMRNAGGKKTTPLLSPDNRTLLAYFHDLQF